MRFEIVDFDNRFGLGFNTMTKQLRILQLIALISEIVFTSLLDQPVHLDKAIEMIGKFI